MKGAPTEVDPARPGRRRPRPLKRLTFTWRKMFKPSVTPIGDGLRVRTDAGLPADIRKALYKECYEADELSLVRAVLRPGDRVLEIGAGIGVIALACAGICGAGNVTSYEANPRTAERIRANFALNGMTARLRERAMATRSGETTFYFSDNIISSSLIDRDFGGETRVPCDDIAAVVRELDPTVIVMDAEGAEIELLPHAELSGVRAMIVELHPRIVGEDAVARLTAELAARGLVVDAAASRGNVALFRRA
jgi:FkbM family methyltransferase